ncbi:hypothetical protein [Rhodococcoides corynebacterioides]|uniref:hypothetical protein n=1 Tax=Rhodococcoides corynebacterioides TaxID=53972 RepID=UPI0008353F28|nr:hypothetical protein [Rhodococcus corynebacterioides]
MRTSRRLRRTVAGLALACAGALAVPAVATAEPATPTTPTTPATGVNPLLAAIAALEGTGSGDGTGSAEGTDPTDPVGDALDAARAVLGAAPTVDVAEPDGNPLALVDAANGLLQGFGLTPFFYPTAALNCSALPGVPFGVVPAVAGAAPGPYTPTIPGVGALPTLPNVDTSIADPGETLYAFVPAPGGIVNDAANKSGMQVAWFNVNTLKGGFADMGGLTDVISAEVIDGLPPVIQGPARDLVQRNLGAFPSAGVRLAPVATGSGTVLAAVFGQVTHDGKTCAFFPTVGLTQVP